MTPNTADDRPAKIPAASFGCPTPAVQWMGDPIELMPTAEALLAESATAIFSDEDIAAALEFYGGDQWSAETKRVREGMGRAYVTVNRLPLLVAAAIDSSWKAGSTYFPRTPHCSPSQNQADAIARLKVIVTRRNKDAQRMFNFECSNALEKMRLEFRSTSPL